MHYDNFFDQVETPMTFLPQVHVSRVSEEVRMVSRDITVAALPRLTPVKG
jgi:hypothetical protein